MYCCLHVYLLLATVIIVAKCECDGAEHNKDTCFQQGNSSCTNALIIASCRALNMTTSTTEGSALPSPCEKLLNPTTAIPTKECNSCRSCQDILQHNPSACSGYYQIQAANGSAVHVYCDMEGTHCGGEGGWTRVAYINMTQSGATCPQGLTQRNISGLTLCGRTTGSSNGVCNRIVFSTLGLNFNRVCGRLRGYQYGGSYAFFSYKHAGQDSIDGYFLDGASITYGTTPRKHIWAYAVGLQLGDISINRYICPCNTNGLKNYVPPFVGNDYYCETGSNVGSHSYSTFYTNDPLWDGQQCVGAEAPCCTHPNMPWFIKTLNETTTEDIEVRICGNHNTNEEDTLLELIELFVY